jgi:hypothetical protein
MLLLLSGALRQPRAIYGFFKVILMCLHGTMVSVN